MSKKKGHHNRSKEERARRCLDLEDSKGYSGTFRWNKTKVFPPLPLPRPPLSKLLCAVRDWKTYLQLRGACAEGDTRDLVEEAQQDSGFVDALSFPLTILYVMNCLEKTPPVGTDKIFNIIMIGASEKAEQRVVQDTNYFEEIGYAFPDSRVRVWVVGPEVGMNVKPRQSALKNLDFRLKKSTAGNFLLANDELRQDPSWRSNTLVICCNGGFGNFELGRLDLLTSWLPDLYLFSSLDIPCVFTCANHDDRAGETVVMTKLVGAKYLVPPNPNPFAMSTTFCPPKGVAGQMQAASCGNSSWYAIKGVDQGLRRIIDTKSKDCQGAIIAALRRSDVDPAEVISRHLHEAHGVEPSTKSSAATERLADAHDTGAPKLNDMQVKKQASKRFETTVPPAAIPETASEPQTAQSDCSASRDTSDADGATPITATSVPPCGAPSPSGPSWTFAAESAGHEMRVLQATITLPEGVLSKEDLALDVSDKTIRVSWMGASYASALLQPVLAETARARFSAKTRTLRVSLDCPDAAASE